MNSMKAVVFKGKDRLAVEEVPKPRPRAGEAVIRITTTTICGTDVHIVRGEYPVTPGLILGHEPVGVIEELEMSRRFGATVPITSPSTKATVKDGVLEVKMPKARIEETRRRLEIAA